MTDVYANLLDYHAGGSDYTAAFNSALASANNVFVPANPAGYNISSPVTLNSRKTLIGAGRGASKVVPITPGAHAFVIPNSGELITIQSLTIERPTATGVTGNGIHHADGNTCDLITIRDVELRNNYNGAELGMTGYSVLTNVLSHHNVNHGFIFNGKGTGVAAVQWYLSQCNAGSNGGGGFVYFSSGTSGGNAMGSLTDCETYHNDKWGVAVLGNASCPFNGFRLDGGLFGEDLWDEVYIDSYGGLHTLRPVFVELAGRATGGSAACGVNISANNTSVSVAIGQANNNAGDGVYTAATDTVINGGIFSGNGSGGVQRNGINVAGGRATITGIRSKGQLNGITANAQTLIVGCDLQGNSGASISGSPAVNTGNRT
jgi:hypothetical protein